MQDESISTINVYDLERAARRQAYEECAAIAKTMWIEGGIDIIIDAEAAQQLCERTEQAIRAKLETMP